MVFGITGNTLKQELPITIEKFLHYLIENKIDFILHDKLSNVTNNFNFLSDKTTLPLKQLINQSDILLVFGGDGTILSFARAMDETKIPIVGINLGKLGFLTEIGVTEIYSFIHDLMSDNYTIEQRSMLEAKIYQEEQCYRYLAMNDIVISRNRTSRLRLLHIEAKVNGEHLITTMSDGIIISTPTGSTAYSLSAHGPIVAPTCKVIIINPICPHALTVRPIIIPDDSVTTVKVNSLNEEVMVTADGQDEIVMKTPFEVCIKKSDFPVKLIRRKSVSYYEVLRSKLMWGKDLRTNER